MTATVMPTTLPVLRLPAACCVLGLLFERGLVSVVRPGTAELGGRGAVEGEAEVATASDVAVPPAVPAVSGTNVLPSVSVTCVALFA